MAGSARKFEATFEVFSPRWGHTDRYAVILTAKELTLSQGINSATCKKAENGDPEWSGYGTNPPISIFENDDIFPPTIVPMALEWAWKRWREEAADDDAVREGLGELFAWIDQTARGKPKSLLFQGAF